MEVILGGDNLRFLTQKAPSGVGWQRSLLPSHPTSLPALARSPGSTQQSQPIDYQRAHCWSCSGLELLRSGTNAVGMYQDGGGKHAVPSCSQHAVSAIGQQHCSVPWMRRADALCSDPPLQQFPPPRGSRAAACWSCRPRDLPYLFSGRRDLCFSWD